MVLNRRAIFFSIMSVLLSSLIIILFSSFLAESFDREALIATEKAEYVSNLVENMDRYLASALQQATYRSVEALIDVYVEANRPFDPGDVSSLEDLQNCLEQGFFSSTIVMTNYCADDYTSFSEALRRSGPAKGVFEEIEDAYTDVTISHQIYNLTVRQTDVYSLQVNASLEVEISTTESTWKRYYNLSEIVSLVGQTDPYYVNSTFERDIELYPGTAGFVYQASWFKNNYSLFANFSNNGFVYKDRSAASFFDVLDGNLPSGIDPDFSEFGYTSVLPGYLDNQSSYQDNQTSSLAHFRNPFFPVSFVPSDLRRINATGMNTNQTLPFSYMINILDGSSSSPELWSVAGCCDNTGCDSMCS